MTSVTSVRLSLVCSSDLNRSTDPFAPLSGRIGASYSPLTTPTDQDILESMTPPTLKESLLAELSSFPPPGPDDGPDDGPDAPPPPSRPLSLLPSLNLINKQTFDLSHTFHNMPSTVLCVITPGDPLAGVIAASPPNPYCSGHMNYRQLKSVYLIAYKRGEADGESYREECAKKYPHLSFHCIAIAGGDGAPTLCAEDRASLTSFLTTLVRSSVLPSLERVITVLSANVSDRRKGLRNVIKSFWRKDNTDRGGDSTIRYRHDSLESCTSMLAWALMQGRDYGGAMANALLAKVGRASPLPFLFGALADSFLTSSFILAWLGTNNVLPCPPPSSKSDYNSDSMWCHKASSLEIVLWSQYAIKRGLKEPHGNDFVKVLSNLTDCYLRGYEISQDEGKLGKEKVMRKKDVSVRVRCATRVVLQAVCTWGGVCPLDGMSLENLKGLERVIQTVARRESPIIAGYLHSVSSSVHKRVGLHRKASFMDMVAGFWLGGDLGLKSELEGWKGDGWRGAAEVAVCGVYPSSSSSSTSSSSSALPPSAFRAQQEEGAEEGWSHITCRRMTCLALTTYADKAFDRRLPLAVYITLLRCHSSRLSSDQQRGAIARIKELCQEASVRHIRRGFLHVKEVKFGGKEVLIQEDGGDDDFMIGRSRLRIGSGAERKKEGDRIKELNKDFVEEVGEVGEIYEGCNNLEEAYSIFFSRLKANSFGIRSKSGVSFHIREQATGEIVAVCMKLSNNCSADIKIEGVEIVAKLKGEGVEYCNSSVSRKDGEKDANDANESKIATDAQGQEYTFENVQFTAPTFGRVVDTDGSMLQEPHFVTSKISLVLKSKSTNMFNLHLTPLKTGHLTVLGYRYRLAESPGTWIYQEFDVPTLPLNDSRHNRATRARQASTENQFQITTNMPSLTITLHNLPETLILGQVAKCNLTIANHGQATANDVYLKCSHPWVYVPSRDLSQDFWGWTSPVPNAVGISGTVTKLPVDAIRPSASTSIPIYVYAGLAGSHDLSFLVRFSASTTSKFRSSIYTTRMNVLAGVHLNTTVSPSFTCNTDFVTSVEIGNSGGAEILIENFVCSSPHFKMKDVYDPNLKVGGLTVPFQQQGIAHLLLETVHEPYEVLTTTSSANGTGADADCGGDHSLYPYLAFFCLLSSSREYRRRRLDYQRNLENEENVPKSIQEIRRAANAAKSRSRTSSSSIQGAPTPPTSLASTCSPELCKADIIVAWKSHATSASGCCFDSVEVRGSTFKSRCPFVITAVYEKIVPFHESGVEKDFVVSVRNRLFSDDPIPFHFDVGSPDGVEISGPQCFKGVLRGGEERKIALRVLYLKRGVFNLQSVRLLVGEIPFLFSFQWVVEVLGEI